MDSDQALEARHGRGISRPEGSARLREGERRPVAAGRLNRRRSARFSSGRLRAVREARPGGGRGTRRGNAGATRERAERREAGSPRERRRAAGRPATRCLRLAPHPARPASLSLPLFAVGILRAPPLGLGSDSQPASRSCSGGAWKPVRGEVRESLPVESGPRTPSADRAGRATPGQPPRPRPLARVSCGPACSPPPAANFGPAGTPAGAFRKALEAAGAPGRPLGHAALAPRSLGARRTRGSARPHDAFLWSRVGVGASPCLLRPSRTPEGSWAVPLGKLSRHPPPQKKRGRPHPRAPFRPGVNANRSTSREGAGPLGQEEEPEAPGGINSGASGPPISQAPRSSSRTGPRAATAALPLPSARSVPAGG